MGTKWSAFAAGSTPAQTDTFVGISGGVNVKWTGTQLHNYVQGTRLVDAITATGNVTIADNDANDDYEINNTSGAAINVYLPDVTLRVSSKPVTIVDVGGNAATHNITVLPKLASGQTIMTGASYVIDSNGSGITLTPNNAGTGWR